MKHPSIIGGEQGEFHNDFTISHQNSASFTSENRISNAKWARDFIKANKITPHNLSKSVAYKNLPGGKKKKAVYDQLRNSLKKEKEGMGLVTEKKEQRVGNTFAFFLSIPVLCIEYVIVGASFCFYKELGFNNVESVSAALGTEMFYMLFSYMKGKGYRVVQFLIFIYSIFTVAYFNIISDPANRARGEELASIERSIAQFNEEIDLGKKDHERFLKTVRIWQRHEKATVANNESKIQFKKFTKLRKEYLSKIDSLQKRKIEILKNESPDFIEQLKSTSVKTRSLVFFYLVAQMCSAICMLLVTQVFKNKKHSRRKR